MNRQLQEQQLIFLHALLHATLIPGTLILLYDVLRPGPLILLHACLHAELIPGTLILLHVMYIPGTLILLYAVLIPDTLILLHANLHAVHCPYQAHSYCCMLCSYHACSYFVTHFYMPF